MKGKLISLGFAIVKFALRLWPYRNEFYGLFVEANAKHITKTERFKWVFEQILEHKEIAAILGLNDPKSRDLARAILQLYFYVWVWFDKGRSK